MWRKILISLMALMGTFSVGYAFYTHEMSASGTSARNVTGRVNKAPSNLSGSRSNIGMKKGDRYYLGKNTVGDNAQVGWQLITDTMASGIVSEPSWLAMTTKPIKKEAAFNSYPLYYIYPSFTGSKVVTGASTFNNAGLAPYEDSNLYVTINDFNRQFRNKDLEPLIGTHIDQHYLRYQNAIIATGSSNFNSLVYHLTRVKEYLRTVDFGKKSFLCMYDFVLSSYSSALSGFQRFVTIPESDWKFYFDGGISGDPFNYHLHSIYQGGTRLRSTLTVVGATGKTENPSNSVLTPYYVRPSIFIQKDPVVFAVSMLSTSSGTSNQIAFVNEPHLPSGYSNIARDAVGDEMKIRRYDNTMTVVLDSDIMDLNNNVLARQGSHYQAAKDKTIQIKANGNTAVSNSTISVMIFNQSGDFVAYSPLGNATGSMTNYTVDLTGLDVGTYQIAAVNEEFNNADTNPARSSLISDVITLEIVEPLSNLSFTPRTNLVYDNNVNANDIVGSISSINGAGIISYSIVEDSAYPNEHQGLASNGSDVIVSGNSLNAGTYHFKIQAQDENGDPNPALVISASITVAKTNTTIVFNDPNMTKKSIVDAGVSWSETATPTPSQGTKITYTKVGGDISMINIDPNTGAITYNGGNAFGKVKIRATVDDDPSTGNDNYNPSFVEKEIVIYREVDGVVTPDPASGDTTIPTFTASDTNIKTGGTIGKIQGTLGTPDTIGGSTTTYSYTIKPDPTSDGSMFQVNASTGVIKANANLGVDTYNFVIIISDKWSSKEIAVTVNVGMAPAENLKFYQSPTSNTIITTKSAALTDTGVTVFATVKGSTNTNPVTYRIQDGSTNVITVHPSSGAITINGVGTVVIVAEKAGANGQANAIAELTFTVTAGSQHFIYTDASGNELPKSGNRYDNYHEVYAPAKTFQLYTTGNPSGSIVTYQLKAGSPTDVISVDPSGLVSVLNASLSSQVGRVIVEATSHDPTGNYSDKTIELPINIEKGTRVISFKEKPIYVTNGKGKVTPVTEVDGVVDTDGDVLIEVDTNEDHTIAWTNDNKTIDYNYSGETGKDIKIHATKPMNRNYKAAEADGTIHVMGPDENILAITSPGQIIYGDHFTIRSSQYDADSTNVQYTFEVDKTTYISNPTVNGNSAEFDAKQFSGSNKTTITVTRTADGETPLSKQVHVTVLPKPIEIIIDDKEKLKGEQNPTLTYQDFRSELVSWNGVQDVIQENDIKLSTTAKTDSNAGAYPIKGDSNTLNKTYPNYSFTFKEGTLKITEENIEDDWYHLELDDGNNTAYTGDWTNQNVNIISDHNEYINLSLDESTWNPNQVTVTKEGETNQSFWMKKDSGAITKEKQEIIRIDKTAPKVKGIKAKDSNNKLQDIINKLSGGIFFKPGTAFEITTSDKKDDLKVSGTKEIAYKVYKIVDGAEEPIKDGTLSVTNEKAKITISETVGKYKVCVIPTDNAGNTNTESCHEVELKKIDVDVDGDGKPDFNDPDGDGCPDLNIKWKDPNDESKWIVINGDRNNDGIPDLNIDSDGDGKPDLNIDTDGDGKPDLNLVILKKGDWKPTKCVKADPDNGILEEYCTGTSVKAVINVDTDNDGIPNINIDSDGDLKADINISKDGINPNINIVELTNWIPDKNYTYQKFSYDTMKDIKPLLNIDSDKDGRPDINIDLDGDGNPDINIDVDGDGIPDIDIDSDGDGKPDVNVDTDGDGKPNENIHEITEWKPNKNVDGDLPYDTMDFSEPTKPTEPNPSVKGQYNPATSMGGANTGDNTNLMLYISLTMLMIGLINYLIYKYKKDTFQ